MIHAPFVSSRHCVSEMLLIQCAFSGPAALASPRNRSEMQTLGPHPRSIESELVFYFVFVFVFFSGHRTACGILVHQPGFEPMRSGSVESQPLNHQGSPRIYILIRYPYAH